MLIVDSQVHIWENTKLTPIHRQVETFSKDDLLAEMKTAAVDAVLLHPPGAVPNGNELALAAAKAHPDKFAVLGWVQPDKPDEARKLLDERLKQPGFLGLRYIFIIPGRENWATDGTMDWIYKACEDKGIPLGLLAFSFLPHLAKVAERHPRLRLLVDHLGVSPMEKDDKAFATLPDLLKLAKYPNVAVKLSGAPVHSSDPYPYRNIHDKMKAIFDAFGPNRCFWGTDLSRMPCTYRQCVTMFTEELPWLKGRDLELVMGEALCKWVGWKLAK
ncbi:MAG: amidohydrolase [Alphaproteobacteria bacterium]|nr:amidohydrolase [Alphaproteobacteria bacterium]